MCVCLCESVRVRYIKSIIPHSEVRDSLRSERSVISNRTGSNTRGVFSLILRISGKRSTSKNVFNHR